MNDLICHNFYKIHLGFFRNWKNRVNNPTFKIFSLMWRILLINIPLNIYISFHNLNIKSAAAQTLGEELYS